MSFYFQGTFSLIIEAYHENQHIGKYHKTIILRAAAAALQFGQ